jgi:EmrB/QacA subfamily drug resistance transporter
MSAADKNYKWKVLVTVGLASMLGAIDYAFVNLSLPLLTKTFKTDLATAVWLNLIFSLSLISLGPFCGKVNDRVGRKNMFLAGTACMTVGLIACSVAQTMGQLIAFRIFHGVGNAMLSTSFAALITDAFPPHERGRGLGLQNASLSLGFLIGPFASGFLLNWLDWRSIFYMRIPLGIIVFVMTLALLKQDRRETSHIRFDYLGSVTSAVGLLALILGITMISRMGIGSPMVYVLIPLGVALLVLFIYVEKRVEDPLVDLSLFRNKEFTGGLLSLLFYWVAVQGYAITMPFYLMESRGFAASHAGMFFTVGSVVSLLFSPVAGYLSDRFGSGLMSAVGGAIVVVGLCFYLNLGPYTTVLFLVALFIVMGIGGGTYLSTNASAIMGAVKPEHRGSASALMMSVTGLSLSLGMSWASTIYSLKRSAYASALTSQGWKAETVPSQSVYLSFHDVVVIAMVFQALVLVFAVLPLVIARLESRRHPGPKLACR